MAHLWDRKNSCNDPYLRPVFTIKQRLRRCLWLIVQNSIYAWSPRVCFEWRSRILRFFGAKIGKNCFFYPKSTIWAPWMLQAEDVVTVADGVDIYNPGGVVLHHHSIISQGAFLCGASHDFNDPAFPMIWDEIRLGAYSWVCARAVVLPGVTLGHGAVLGAAAVAAKSLDELGVYIGNPARKVSERRREGAHLSP